MTNPFEKLTKKDWLYIAGAVASLVALWLIFFWKKTGDVLLPPDATSDQSVNPVSLPPGYTNYNIQPILPEPLPGTNPGDTPAGGCGCACPSALGCAGTSMLDTGNAYTSLSDLIGYYQSLNSNFANMYSSLTAPYAFGYAYNGAVAVPAPNN